MQTPLDITFRDMTPSPALVTDIEEWTRKLEAMFPIQRCTVIVEKPQKHRFAFFTIHLTITIPGHEVAVSRSDRQARDAYLAVAEAFRAARRQLVDFTSQRRDARPAL
jgi:hypothetical protein